MSQQGKIKFFDSTEEFGFIAPDEGDKEIFAHRSTVENLGSSQGFKDEEAMEFDVEEASKGLRAINVRNLDYK